MSKNVKCPNCGHHVDLSEALRKELKDDFDSNLQKEVDKKTSALNKQLEQLTASLQKYMEQAGSEKLKVSELELKLQNTSQEAELIYNKKLLAEKESLYIAGEKNLEERKKAIEQQAELKVNEKLDTIRQLQEQLVILQQKAEQGSMQQQGEAQEVLIEDFLKASFPLDNINEIKKGSLGADTLQVVNTRSRLSVGSIYYESKRTKAFNNLWIEKFKKDLRELGGDVGVIVTTCRPTGFDRACQMNGVWICTLEEFKVISQTLREALIRVSEAVGLQENKTDKMSLLYNYLSSNEFKLQIEAIVEGFSQLQSDLDSEKRSMQMIWSKREKQIQKVIDSTIGMYGSIKGIGGSQIQNVPALELS